MTFTQETNITKTGIEDFEIRFFVPGPGNTENVQTGELSVQVLQSDGSLLAKSYDLLLSLTDDAPGLVHLANLASLRDYLRTRLNNEVLP